MPARDRAARLEKEMGSGKMWTAPVSEFDIRVLPSPESKKGAEDDLFLEYMVHENVGPDKRFLRCGHDVSGKGKCIGCDKEIPKLQKAGKDERAAALAPRKKMAVQIATVDESGEMDGPKMWGPNQKVQRGLIAKIFNNRKHDYTDPKKGHNLHYKRVGKGKMDTEYFGPDVADDATPVPKGIMKKLTPIIEAKKGGYYIIPRYDEAAFKKALSGGEASSSSEEDSESSAASKGSSESSASGSESVSLSSSEEKPKKGKKGSKSKKESSEDEDRSSEASSSEDESSAAAASSSDASSSEDAASSEESEKPKKGKGKNADKKGKKNKKDESSEEESSEDASSEEESS